MNTAAIAPREAALSPVRHDGRNRRAADTRRKIIAASRTLISETGTAPTVVGVARRSGVSVRSVFQHFGDVESLFVTVFDDVREAVMAFGAVDAGAALPKRIDAVVDRLADLYEQVVPLRIAAGQFGDTNRDLVERRESTERDARAFLSHAFAAELAEQHEPARAELSAALEAAVSIDTWIVLRRGSRLDPGRAKAVWRRLLTALFDHGQAEAGRAHPAHD